MGIWGAAAAGSLLSCQGVYLFCSIAPESAPGKLVREILARHDSLRQSVLACAVCASWALVCCVVLPPAWRLLRFGGAHLVPWKVLTGLALLFVAYRALRWKLVQSITEMLKRF